MKSLHNYISERLVINKDFENIKTFSFKPQYRKHIKIFDRDWPEFETYKDKVYINDKKININPNGTTGQSFFEGLYEFEIKGIDNIKTCDHMFSNCTDLFEVPEINTTNVRFMNSMFSGCTGLYRVPLFDVSNVENMSWMFYACENLSTATVLRWTKIYNFSRNDKININNI